MSEVSGTASDVILRVEDCVGRITLNRPQALNALTLAMITVIDQQLQAWANDPAVVLVMIEGAGGRAFCAGGDIQWLYAQIKAGHLDEARGFFRAEYRLNRLIARYPKPLVAIMQGIVIGGGVGISAHAAHRIVTEHTLLALPECSIGLIPDVGTSLLLARAPGSLGAYIGLTGARLSGADAIAAGFADTFVPSDRVEDFVTALLDDPHPAMIDCLGWTPGPSELAARTAEISAIFDASSPVEIATRLASSTAAWAPAALTALRKAAPLSLSCTLAAIDQARTDDTIESALATEFRFVSRAVVMPDFTEGIRAAVIDKDRAPVWMDASLAAISPDRVAAMFAAVEPDVFEG